MTASAAASRLGPLPKGDEHDRVVHAVDELEHDLPPGMVDRLVADLRSSPGAERYVTCAPFTGKPLFSLPIATGEDIEAAFDEARRAQQTWAAVPATERAALIGRVHHEVLRRRHELVDLLQLEGGKARYDAFAEAAGVAVYSRFFARTAPSALEPKRRFGMIPVATLPTEHRRPKGVVGLVTAWNFPAIFAAADGFAALVAGNAVVHRPDKQTALSALWVRSVAVEVGLPPQLWQVLLGPGAVTGPEIIRRADYVAFTGSTEVGREIATAAGGRLIGVSLELGGKNPLVVLSDANLKRAAAGAMRATFTNCGQACVGTERLLVAESVHAELVELLLDEIAKLRLGTDLSYGFEMGSLVNQSQLDRVTRHVQDAVAQGATLLHGGRPRPDIGPYFFEPTLLTGVRPGMLAWDEETFGPVLSVTPFSSVAEAVELANATEYGLHASVWSRDTKAAQQVAAQIRAGTVEINDGYFATWGSPDVPQGGMKDSGLGRRNGRDGILRFTEAQSVTVQRFHGVHPPKGLTQERFADVMAKALRALHATGRP